jgi:flavodoxin I
MEKIGLFYSINTKNTSTAAGFVRQFLGEDLVDTINVEVATENDFRKYDKFILGVPTWWDGELPNYWDEFLPCVEGDSMEGKTFAIYGAGDQKGYPDNFADAIGIMAKFIEKRGGKVIGFTKNTGYTFDASRALTGDVFVGLPLDFESQEELVEPRIKAWVNQITKEFAE